MRTMYILRTDDRPTTNRPRILENLEWPIGHISAMGHPIHFMFGSMVGFSRSADRMALLLVSPNPRWSDGGWPPSWKILYDHISGMSYPIHFHELQSSLEE